MDLDDVFNCSGAEGASLNTLFEAADEIAAFMLERGWLDAESIVRRQVRLDENYVLGHLRDLFELKDAPESLARAVRLLKENA